MQFNFFDFQFRNQRSDAVQRLLVQHSIGHVLRWQILTSIWSHWLHFRVNNLGLFVSFAEAPGARCVNCCKICGTVALAENLANNSSVGTQFSAIRATFQLGLAHGKPQILR